VKRPSRRRRIAAALALGAVLVAAVFFVLTAARPSDRLLPAHTPDVANGEMLFHAGGCMACHKPPFGADDSDLPTGRAAFSTPIGTMYPGNLTPDPDTGIGRWTAEEFVDAMTEGVSPDHRHYFPAFPYTSYRNMRDEDVLDLRAYLMSLPPVRSSQRDADVPMIGLARRIVGLWKRFAFRGRTFRPDPDRDAVWNRGAYLVQGPGHCGECHTPRNALMILDDSRQLEGGPHPRGEGHVPSLRNLIDRGRYADAADLTLALQFGETLGYDKLSSGGMAAVQMNLARLPEDDLRAISEYVVSLR
jgi:mono/diheme cytochrome c family protein